MRNRNKFCALVILLCIGNGLFSQQLKLGKFPYQVQKSAVLELESDNQGLLYPRINDTLQINALNPRDGTVIYFIPQKVLLLRSNGVWQPITLRNELRDSWSINGNANGSMKMIGNTDNFALQFITNNLERLRINANGNVGIGLISPTQKLEVTGNFRLNGAFMPGNNAGTAGALLMSSGANLSPTWIEPTGYLESISWQQGGNIPTSMRSFGTRTNYAVQFITNNLERMRLTEGGFLGLGTTTAGNFLEVASTNAATGISGIRLKDLGTATPAAASAKLLSVAANGDIIVTANPGFTSWLRGGNDLTVAQEFGTRTNFDLPFIVNNTERMRLTTAGFLGVGTMAPGNVLEVGGTSNFKAGLRLSSIGSAVPTASNGKVLSVDSNGDIIVTGLPTSTGWTTLGNTGTNWSTNFLGTIDDQPLVLKSNNESYIELGRRQTLGLTQGYPDYSDQNEHVLHLRTPMQFFAPNAQFYKPKIFVDNDGNFRVKGSSAGTDYFEFGATGTNNNGGFEFIIGDDGDEPILFKSYHYVNGMSEIMRLQNGRMAVGANTFDPTNPEKLLIDAGVTNSFNLMTGKGSIDNYLQINVQNRSAGGTASSDLVATADNGTESSNYVDLGINSSGFNNTSYPIIGGVNNAYLYATGNDFVIGNGTVGRNLRFFTGGFTNANERLRIDATGNIGIGNLMPTQRLDVTGNIRFSGALMPNNNAGTAGMVLTSAGAGAPPTWTSVAGSGWSLSGNAVAALSRIGTTTNYDLPFITNNAEAMRITTTNRIGIGYTAPTEILDVNGNIRIGGGNKRLIFGGMAGDPDAVIENRYYGASENSELLFYVGNDMTTAYGPDRIRMVAEEFRFQTFNNSGNSTLANAEAGTLSLTRFVIDPTGNTGINNALPTEKLDVTGNFRLSGAFMPNNIPGTAGMVLTSAGANAPPTWTSPGSNAWNIGGNAVAAISNLGTTNFNDFALITNNVERMRILAGGNIGIGLTNPGFRLHVNGDAAMQNDVVVNNSNTNNGDLNTGGLRFGSTSGEGIASKRTATGNQNGLDFYTGYTRRLSIANGGTISALANFIPASDWVYNLGSTTNRWLAVYATNGTIQTSDRRQKTNISKLGYGLSEVMRLNPVQYNWKNDADNNGKLGLIAQDVRSIVPEVVIGDESKEMLGINYSELVPVLINAIKEQQQQIDELRKELIELKKKN